MKEWFKSLVKRIGDLILKLLSAKVVAAVAITYFAQRAPSEMGVIVVAAAWFGVVGARYAEKRMYNIKGQ